MTTQQTLTSALGAAMLTLSALIFAQAPAAPPALPSATPPAPAAATQGRQDCMGPRGFALPGPAAFESVEVLPDRRITFRLCAPDAREVLVTSSDFGDVIPMGFGGGPAGLELTRGEQGVWSGTTTRAAAPDTYRFNFRVVGVGWLHAAHAHHGHALLRFGCRGCIGSENKNGRRNTTTRDG